MNSLKNIILLFFLISYNQISFSQEKVSYKDFIQKKENLILNKDYVTFKIDTLSNSDFLNKVTIINFWFESCAPCIAEMEGLNKLYEKNKNNKNFQFISFCTDNLETINKNLKKYTIEYSVTAIEKGKAYELNYNSGFPSTFIINSEGKVIYFSLGGPVEVKKATEKGMSIYDQKINEELIKSRQPKAVSRNYFPR